MNIVYISMLNGKKSAGLSYSIPAQVKSQSQFDNVFWYNINDTPKDKIINGSKCYNKSDYPSLNISNLPIPFNKPDLVIFEGVYFIEYVKIAKQCSKDKIPYIIIPRSSLTYYAQKKKLLKKVVGNLFFFNNFIKKALAIQYLTTKEFVDSGEKWNKRHLIIPNGVDPKKKIKQNYLNDEIKGVFIGRPDSYQKGLDLLLDACVPIKEELKANNFKINIFAPASQNDNDNIQEMITARKLNDIIFKHGGIYGAEKEEVLLDSDLFILTSRFEGHPMGLIEALSYGLPCLVTEGTNMAEEICLTDSGWTAKTDVDSIVQAFKAIFNEKKRLAEKGNNACELSKKYNWTNLAKISSEEYIKLLKNN